MSLKLRELFGELLSDAVFYRDDQQRSGKSVQEIHGDPIYRDYCGRIDSVLGEIEKEGNLRNVPRAADGLEALRRWAEQPANLPPMPPQGPSNGGPGAAAARTGRGRRIIQDGGIAERRYNAIWGEQRDTLGFESFDEFLHALQNRLADPRLTRSMSEGFLADGGAFVPPAFSNSIFDASLEDEIVRPRATIFPMESNELTVPAWAIGDHSAGVYGGMQFYWKGESAEFEEDNPKGRQITFYAEKLTGLVKTTNELLEDGIGFSAQMNTVLRKGLGWFLDLEFLQGSGAGRPVGILNGSCTLTVAAEDGQEPNTILYKNLTNMLASTPPASFNKLVWVAHVSALPQLMELEIPIGTGGEMRSAVRESANGGWTLLTRPLLFTEKLYPLGSRGDLLLADFSAYGVGMRKDARIDLSPHRYFTTDETLWRIKLRGTGLPLWNEPMTLADGETQVSPFVVLAARP